MVPSPLFLLPAGLEVLPLGLVLLLVVLLVALAEVVAVVAAVKAVVVEAVVVEAVVQVVAQAEDGESPAQAATASSISVPLEDPTAS